MLFSTLITTTETTKTITTPIMVMIRIKQMRRYITSTFTVAEIKLSTVETQN
jgi:hypothetical protein